MVSIVLQFEALGADQCRRFWKILHQLVFGLCQVTRGALGHWLRLEGGRITHYQIITPSAWNASPRDQRGGRGPCEQALLGTPLPDAENPAALGHVVRSFDPCLVCTVHAVRNERVLGSVRLQG